MSLEFHIYGPVRKSFFELEMPGKSERIEFTSLFAAAKHARKQSAGKDAMVVIHDRISQIVNRIPMSCSS